MKINELQDAVLNSKVEIEGVVKTKEIKKKRNGEDYMQLSICDGVEELSFPVWEHVEERDEKIQVGQVVRAVGTVGTYGGRNQLVLNGFGCPSTDNPRDFIPTYMNDDRFDGLIQYLINGIDRIHDDSIKNFICHCLFADDGTNVLDVLYEENNIRKVMMNYEVASKYITAPAAVKHHQNKLGGLLVHSIGVLANVLSMIDIYTNTNPINPYELFIDAGNVLDCDLLIAGAILHDIGKITEYKYDNALEKNEEDLGHRMTFIKMSQTVNDKYGDLKESRLCQLQNLVMRHHGPWGGNKPRDINSTLLWLADMIDSRIAGCAEQNTVFSQIDIKSMIDAE